MPEGMNPEVGMEPEHDADLPQGLRGPDAASYLFSKGVKINGLEFGRAWLGMMPGQILEFEGADGKIALQLALDGSGKFDVVEGRQAAE